MGLFVCVMKLFRVNLWWRWFAPGGRKMRMEYLPEWMTAVHSLMKLLPIRMKCGDFYESKNVHESMQVRSHCSLGMHLFCTGSSFRSSAPVMGGLGEWSYRDFAGSCSVCRRYLLYNTFLPGERTLSPWPLAGCQRLFSHPAGARAELGAYLYANWDDRSWP